MLAAQKGATGLLAAAQHGHEAVVRLLLEHKADPSAVNQVCVLSHNDCHILLISNPPFTE